MLKQFLNMEARITSEKRVIEISKTATHEIAKAILFMAFFPGIYLVGKALMNFFN